MKDKFRNKKISATSIIQGADGPTAIFLAGKMDAKQTIRQKIHRLFYDARKKRVVKSLKANPHSMDEVADYIVAELGFLEADKAGDEYKTTHFQMRASFLMQYRPELLGDLAEAPRLGEPTEENLRLFMAQLEKRQKAAEGIPPDIFDIDLHIYEKNDEDNQSRIILEKNYGYIGGSSSAPQNSASKIFDKIFRKIFQYYGVTQEDIEKHTERYQTLVKILARG